MEQKQLTTSNCPERTKTKFQPGGTATLITGKWEHHSDLSISCLPIQFRPSRTEHMLETTVAPAEEK
eukprot:15359733-Ditylum_brightwellii.AAC.1